MSGCVRVGSDGGSGGAGAEVGEKVGKGEEEKEEA